MADSTAADVTEPMNRLSHNLVGVLCVLGFVSSVLAQKNAEPTPLDAAREALGKARIEFTDATAAVSRAEVARMKLEKSIRVEFSSAPDLATARDYLGEATRYYNSLRNVVRSEFSTDPDYLSLRDEIAAAEGSLRVAREDETTSLSQTLKLMQELMAARTELTRFEAAAFALDPEIEDARVLMNNAYEAFNKLERTYALRASNDPRLKTADAEVNHAKDRVAQARQALFTASVTLAAAEKAEAARKTRRRADQPPIRRADP